MRIVHTEDGGWCLVMDEADIKRFQELHPPRRAAEPPPKDGYPWEIARNADGTWPPFPTTYKSQ